VSSFEQGFIRPRKDNGGTNTGDATATSNDLAIGAIAYAKGLKITGNGINAKKYANGTLTNTTATKSFYDWTGHVQKYFVQVSGLDFLPSVIIITRGGGYTSYSTEYTFRKPDVFLAELNQPLIRCSVASSVDLVVANGSFCLPVKLGNSPFVWDAYE